MKLCIFLCLATLAMSAPLALDEEWKQWKSQHSKTYSDEIEESVQRAVWFRTFNHIQEHNSAGDSYKLDLNKFADMTDEEFSSKFLTPGMETMISSHTAEIYEAPQNLSAPTSLDWRRNGLVTSIKDQGTCGSSWAFSATGSLEGQLYKATRKLSSLSEQQLLDCSGILGNSGCSGGLSTTAYKYLDGCGGICSESSYPYLGYVYYCAAQFCRKKASTYGYGFIQPGSEQNLLSATYSQGPISVAVDAASISFRFYTGGIYYDTECSKSNLNHAMLIVGYSTDSSTGLDYWILKNSWGIYWGDSGYMKLARNQNNMCGIATAAVFPKLEPRY